MSWRNRWAVLAPGKPAWLEKRAREILDEEGDGSEIHFTVISGQGRYQALLNDGRDLIGSEALIGSLLSLECEEPVYAIEGRDDFPYISRFLKGEERYEGQEPEDLVRSLGCTMPWFDEPPPELKRVTRTAALVQGLSKARVLNALAKEMGRPLTPEDYRVEETSLGLLLGEGASGLGFPLLGLARRFPRATLYTVIATPNLDYFVINVQHNRKTREFVPPPREATYYPPIYEVMGEREPERILAALGIPKEWFLL